MYGVEAMGWSEEHMRKLDVIQKKVGRLRSGAKRYVGAEAVRGERGCSSFVERYEKDLDV